MTILTLRDAVVSTLQAAVPANVDVQALRTELPTESFQAPAVMVYLGSVEATGREASVRYQEWSFGALILAKDFSGTGPGEGPGGRGDAALLLVQTVCTTVEGNYWANTASEAPTRIRAGRIRTEKFDKKGLSVWLVTWRQRLDAETISAETLAPFLRLRTSFDFVEDDGERYSEAATGTVTVGSLADGETLTVGAVTLTARTLATLTNEVTIGSTPAASAAAVALALTALSAEVSAVAVGATITVSALTRGAAGNAIAMSETGSGFVVGAATLAGGQDYPMYAEVNFAASGTVTCGTVIDGSTVAIAGIVFVAKTAPTVAYEFAIGTAAETAAALQAAIAASGQLDEVVLAYVDSAVVTVRAFASGSQGNAVTLAVTGSGLTISGATLTGGRDH